MEGSRKTFNRVESVYVDESKRFVLQKRAFERQYAHIYAARLWSLRPRLEKAAKKQWGDAVLIRSPSQARCKLDCQQSTSCKFRRKRAGSAVICGPPPESEQFDFCSSKLSELQSDEDCVIIGTLYKQMKMKPSILKEISEQNGLVGGPLPSNGFHSRYTDPSDELVLEDEVQRISLAGDIDVAKSISGTVLAVFGREREDQPGKFVIRGVAYADMVPQIPRTIPQEDRFLVFVSGLEIGKSTDDLLSRQFLADTLTGQLGDEKFQETMSRVVRIVVAGNSLSDLTRDRGVATRAKYLSKKTAVGTRDAIMGLDDLLVQLASGVDVDLMPGEFDPASFTMPQQPLHLCMFPRAGSLETLHCVTNPHQLVIDGVTVLGTSGQPVVDVLRFTEGLDDHLEVLERTLVAGHLAPTAPDTLGCYPYADQDPFIIESCPHVFFSGNSPTFGTRMFRADDGSSVLLVAVPCFAATKSFVSVNLRTMDCREFVFDGGFGNGTDQNADSAEMDTS